MICIICKILLAFHLLLGVYISFNIRKLYKKFGHPLYQKVDIPEKYLPTRRTDYQNWCPTEMYICSFLLFPIRLFSSLVILVTFISTLLLGTLGFKLEQPWPKARYTYIRPILILLARLYLLASGFLNVKQKTLRFEDFIPNYKKTALSNNKASIIISNHQSWYDTIVYVYKYLPSFMSKESVKHFPLFGWITTSLKSIYVKRESEESRKKCMEDLNERVKLIDQGQLYPPIIIFPEGTTTNGEFLLAFKRGAFENLTPVKICVLKYSKRRFHPVQDVIGQFALTIFSLTQLYNEVEICEFEGVFDPTYLQLENYPQEQRWQIYANACRDVMAKALGIPFSNAGYRDGMEYQNVYVKGKMKNE